MRRLISTTAWIITFAYVATHLGETGAAIINVISIGL